MKILCFDVGGTAIKYGLFKDDQLIDFGQIKTRKTKSENFILEDIIIKIKEYKGLSYIGISTAGVVDTQVGQVVFAGPTIPAYSKTEFKKELEEVFAIPCIVENDVNAASYGEYRYGHLKALTACMTVGTGLGCGIILNDTIFTGSSMTAGEIGYLPYKNMSLQDYASASFLEREGEKAFNRKINGKEIFDKAKAGNKEAIEIVEDLVEGIVYGILTISYLINPQTIIIGGGISGQGDYLKEILLSKLKKEVIDDKFLPEIRLAQLENKAGLYGMYYKIKDELNE